MTVHFLLRYIGLILIATGIATLVGDHDWFWGSALILTGVFMYIIFILKYLKKLK